MSKSLFNAAQYEITQPVLRPGNYLAKIVRIEDVEKGQGNQFFCEFSAPKLYEIATTYNIELHIMNQMKVIQSLWD